MKFLPRKYQLADVLTKPLLSSHFSPNGIQSQHAWLTIVIEGVCKNIIYQTKLKLNSIQTL
jgi:hypothetical protein